MCSLCVHSIASNSGSFGSTKSALFSLFNIIDHFIFMKIPNFKMVFKWRLLQEKKLRKKSYSNKKIMNYKEIKRFIMFYQRIIYLCSKL